MIVTSKRYNGWTNYETWCVNLWISSEESSYRYWDEVATEEWDNAEPTEIFNRPDTARYTLANRLKDETLDGSPLRNSANMYSDLLGAALSEVDWDEIANALLADHLAQTKES